MRTSRQGSRYRPSTLDATNPLETSPAVRAEFAAPRFHILAAALCTIPWDTERGVVCQVSYIMEDWVTFSLTHLRSSR